LLLGQTAWSAFCFAHVGLDGYKKAIPKKPNH